MFVMTVDQRGSGKDIDRVPEVLVQLKNVPALLPFERTAGDEIQAVFQNASAVVEVSLELLRTGHWYVGIGIGAVKEPLPESSRAGQGSAFLAARHAVDRAKAAAKNIPLAVVSNAAPQQAAHAEAVLRLLGQLIERRTASQWNVVDALAEVRRGTLGHHGEQKAVAEALEMSEQAVSTALRRAALTEELAARPAAAALLTTADQFSASREGQHK
ncbi:MarR family transcriptional regulator [Pseudarthrobacter sp. J1738]|uniref:MarR family transcriptional regulator n=1 Tax=Pseudarthrobacter sp. J1738 TaxID=3420446 RepID=UPI003D2BED18